MQRGLTCSHRTMFTIFIMTLVSSVIAESNLWNNNERLRKALLKDYDKGAFPHAGPNDTTTIYYGLVLKSVWIEDDIQVLNVNCWVQMVWYDPRLMWDYKDYGNLKMLHLASHESWQPDLSLYNNADITNTINYGKTNVMVDSNGMVAWVPPTTFRVECPLDFTYWPFDIHHCQLFIGSWTTHGWQLDVQLFHNNTKVTMGWFGKDSSEWQLIKGTIQRDVLRYQGYEEPYISIIINLTMERVSGTFTATIVIPACVISALILIQFLLPVREKKRVLIGCVCVLLTLIEIVYLGSSIPRLSSSTPIIVTFYGQVLIITCLSVATTCFILRLTDTEHPAASTPPPNIVRTIVSGPLSSLLFLQHYTEKVSRSGGGEEDGEVLEESKNSVNYGPDWLLVAAVFDRLAAIGFLITFVVTLVAYVARV